jgi:hypothetical protein
LESFAPRPGPHATLWLAAAVAVAIGYGDVLFGGRTFLPAGQAPAVYAHPPYVARWEGPPADLRSIDPGAHAWQVHPWAYAERRALARGELPLWNRHAALGQPLLANGQASTLSPVRALVLLDPDAPWLWDAYHLFLRFLAALFSGYLLHRLGAPLELCLAGVAFGALHGSFTALLNRDDLAVFALLPAVLFCTVRLRQAPGFASALALAVATVSCLQGGHPQPAFASLLVAAALAAGMLAWPGPGSRARFAAEYAGAMALAAFLSAPYWLPFLAYLADAWHFHPPGVGEEALPPFAALQWIAPGALSPSFAGLVYRDWPVQGFLGGFAAFAAAAGVVAALTWRALRPRLAWLAAPALFALKIFGAPGTSWLGELPLLSQAKIWQHFQFPVLYALGIAGLAALGELRAAGPRRRALTLGGAAGLVLVALLCAPLYAPPTSVDEATGRSAGLSPAWGAQAAAYGGAATLAALLAALGTAARPRGRWRRAALAALAVATFAELASYRYPLPRRVNPTAPAPYVEWLQARARERPPFRVMGLGDTFMPNLATAFALDDARACDAFFLPEYVRLVRRFLQRDLRWGWFLSATAAEGFRARGAVLDLLGVRYLVAGPGERPLVADPGRYRVAYADEGLRGGAVVENLRAWPRVFAVGAPVVLPDPKAVLDAIARLPEEGTEPAAYVASDFPAAEWAALGGGAPVRASVSELRYGTNDFALRVEVDRPAVLVVGDAFARGWRARVDGEARTLFRANYVFRGVLVPAGRHEVRFSYWPTEWTVAFALAGAGALAAVAWGLARRRRRAA